MVVNRDDIDYDALAAQIKTWAGQLGFQQIGIGDIDLDQAETHLLNWLRLGRHGEMAYMARHGKRRTRPSELLPGTIKVISARMDYLPQPNDTIANDLERSDFGFVSRYALGRDYHKVLRKRLQKLADRITNIVGPFGYRAFVDSAPVMEKALAEKAGLGWIGKHTNLINTDAGSWFFLGELYTDLPLPTDHKAINHCGTCQACIDCCPTNAIVAPYQVDARRCISYLTIELRGSIPVELRPLIGNRIFGCDDCQMVCPWNKFAQISMEKDFTPRTPLTQAALITLFLWSQSDFHKYTEGSAIRRIGYECWIRNIAVALGNAPSTDTVIEALQKRAQHPSELVREHVSWALSQHQ